MVVLWGGRLAQDLLVSEAMCQMLPPSGDAQSLLLHALDWKKGDGTEEKGWNWLYPQAREWEEEEKEEEEELWR